MTIDEIVAQIGRIGLDAGQVRLALFGADVEEYTAPPFSSIKVTNKTDYGLQLLCVEFRPPVISTDHPYLTLGEIVDHPEDWRIDAHGDPYGRRHGFYISKEWFFPETKLHVVFNADADGSTDAHARIIGPSLRAARMSDDQLASFAT